MTVPPDAEHETEPAGPSETNAEDRDRYWREVGHRRWEERWAEYAAGYGIVVGRLGPDGDGQVSCTNMVRSDGDSEPERTVLLEVHQPDATADGYGWGQVMLSLQQAHYLHQRLGRLLYQATYGGELE